MAGQITWFEIMGGDAARQHDFYAQLFGWKLDVNKEMQYGMVAAEQAGVGGGIGPTQDGSPGYVTVYIGVDDIKACMAKVEKLGGKVVMPPTELPDFQMLFGQFADPDGHVIGVTQFT